MRLKALRAVGFKSFAHKTDFSFPDGVTCIVGPNGCGKSNVVDAVKWVLGEQRPTALRGAEMADVIFSGTATRKALGMAEVALTFDNGDGLLGQEWTEVEVTRRLYRDGTSEYLLNRNRCRLRDLRELLMDTGSGPGALTFMEQGKIDQILRESRDERRLVFEEAAGISRYKARRKEALRRLEKVEADLLRISDVVEEKRRLVRSLRIQAGRAERYQGLADEMQRLRLELAVFRYGRLLGDREEATSRVEMLTIDEEAARAAVREAVQSGRAVELEVEAGRQAVARKEQEIASLEGRADGARDKATFAARLVAELDGKTRWYQDEIESSGDRLEHLDGIRDGMVDALRDAEEAQTLRTTALATADAALADARRLAAERRQAAESAADRVYLCLNRHGELDSRRSRLDARAQGLSDRQEQLAERARTVATEAEDCAARVRQTTLASESAEGALADAAATLAGGETLVAGLEEDVAAGREAVSALDREASGARSRRDVLLALRDRMEGVGEGARNLIEAAGTDSARTGLTGVRGVLADLIETDAADAAVVESALGAHAGAVVVETFEDAARAARYLMDMDSRQGDRLGRAVILPLETVRRGAQALPEIPADAAARRVLGAVRCDDDLRSAVAALLADAVVVEDLDVAARLHAAGGTGPRVRLVTVGGAVVEPAGTVTAGGAAGGAGILQRNTELREVETRLEELTASLRDARSSLSGAEDRLSAARAEVGAARTALREAESTAHRARSGMDRAKAEEIRLGREREAGEADLAGVVCQMDETRAAMEEIADEIRTLAHEREEAESARTLAQSAVRAAEQALQEAEGVRTDARVGLASAAEKCTSLRARMEDVEREFGELTEGVEEARAELAACRERRESAQQKVKAAHEELERSQRQRELCIRDLAEMRHGLGAAQARQAEQREALAAVEETAQTVGRELQRLRLRENEARVRVETLIERIQEEMQMDLHAAWQAAGDRSGGAFDGASDDAAPEGESRFDPDDVETRITDLRSKLARMGNVNLEALDQLRLAETESSTLEKELTDLQSARSTLLQTVRRIDAESRTLFTTTFDAVRKNFQEMFRRLFGGGKADVTLEEGADVLEAGVEIVARPPGKELRAISLLSGGERTMTAVALMFAIYMAKPSPFCLLDEVDAALDETNIDRFVGVLSGFAAQSQFIIVTHNKRTMGMADTIFGVSMPEPGVSRKIAVRLEDVGSDGQPRAASGAA